MSVYIYSGTDRSNLTTLIEANSTAVVGAPYKVKLSDGAVIVARALVSPSKTNISASNPGSLNFSF